MRKLINIILGIICPFFVFSQCANNLIKNSSFELDSIGENQVGSHWIAVLGSPDIDNALDEFPPIGSNTTWTDTVLSSSDGGNWQNIAGHTSFDSFQSFESVGQEVVLQNSIPHILEFEFTAQDFGPSIMRSAHAAIDVFINNDKVYTSHLDTVLFVWEKVEFSFTPKSKKILIRFMVNPDLDVALGKTKYVAIDGVCLRATRMSMFCDP